MKEIIENGKKFSNQCKLIVDENKEEAFNGIKVFPILFSVYFKIKIFCRY